MTHVQTISVVIPVYKGENTIEELVFRIDSTLKRIGAKPQIILVDDLSPDNSWEIIRKLKSEYENSVAIRLSKNFGQHYAIHAGLEHANGDFVVVMDCDLQDVPEEIEKLYSKVNEGYDIVLAKRKLRSDNFFKKLNSKLFYILLSYLTDTKQNYQVANYGIYRKKVITAVLSLGDKIKVFPIMVKWVGFSSTEIDVKHAKRNSGRSTYSNRKLFNLAWDIMISFSNKPLKLTIKLGFIISFLSLIVGCIYLIKYFQGEILVSGYTSLILSIWFLSGIIIFAIGILGLYLSKTFESSKDRPIYIIQEKIF